MKSACQSIFLMDYLFADRGCNAFFRYRRIIRGNLNETDRTQ